MCEARSVAKAGTFATTIRVGRNGLPGCAAAILLTVLSSLSLACAPAGAKVRILVHRPTDGLKPVPFLRRLCFAAGSGLTHHWTKARFVLRSRYGKVEAVPGNVTGADGLFRAAVFAAKGTKGWRSSAGRAPDL